MPQLLTKDNAAIRLQRANCLHDLQHLDQERKNPNSLSAFVQVKATAPPMLQDIFHVHNQSFFERQEGVYPTQNP